MAPASHSLDRWRIAQAAPVHALEARGHVWANLAARLVLPMPPMPSTATSRQRSSSTQRRSSASSSARPTKPVRVGRLTPILDARSRREVSCRRRGHGEQPGEPLLVERGVHPRRLPLDGGPQLARLRRLPPGAQAARLEQRSDEALEPLGSRELDAGLPVLD